MSKLEPKLNVLLLDFKEKLLKNPTADPYHKAMVLLTNRMLYTKGLHRGVHLMTLARHAQWYLEEHLESNSTVNKLYQEFVHLAVLYTSVHHPITAFLRPGRIKDLIIIELYHTLYERQTD